MAVTLWIVAFCAVKPVVQHHVWKPIIYYIWYSLGLFRFFFLSGNHHYREENFA